MPRTGVFRIGIVFILLALLALLCAGEGLADTVWPESAGVTVLTNGKLIVDASHADQGYVMVKVSAQTGKRLKLRVAKGQSTLTYDLNGAGEYEVFPLQLGSGGYDFSLYENVSGTKYSSGGKVSLNVQLISEDAAFLVTNQYVSYLEDSVTVCSTSFFRLKLLPVSR